MKLNLKKEKVSPNPYAKSNSSANNECLIGFDIEEI
jgi:hypothetical protein